MSFNSTAKGSRLIGESITLSFQVNLLCFSLQMDLKIIGPMNRLGILPTNRAKNSCNLHTHQITHIIKLDLEALKIESLTAGPAYN